jgi:hypothetical protein
LKYTNRASRDWRTVSLGIYSFIRCLYTCFDDVFGVTCKGPPQQRLQLRSLDRVFIRNKYTIALIYKAGIVEEKIAGNTARDF